MKKIIWIGLLLFFSFDSYSQLSLGLTNGNYSALGAGIINPSSMANTKLKAEIHVLSANGFVENNYLYFPSRTTTFLEIASGAYDYPLLPKPYGQGSRYVYSNYEDKSSKNYFINTRVMGPSAMVTLNDHVFAIRTGVRAMSSTRRMPYDMANFCYYGMDFKPQHRTLYFRDNYDMSAMAWWEVSLSYATVFNRGKSNLWSVGISVGPLFGYSGAYAKGGDTKYLVYNGDILNVELLNAEFGYAIPVDDQTNEVDWADPLVRGTGWGMDIGVTWQYRDKPYHRQISSYCYKKKFEEYQFKFGISLIDIGWINFYKEAEKHNFINVHNNWIRVNELDYNNIKDEIRTTSELFYNDSTASLTGNSFQIFLPASVGLQFDYHVKSAWYVNAVAVIPAKYAEPMIERPMVIAVTPRYESRFIEVQLPLVLYDFKYPRFGLSLRIDGLTVGSDNLLCFTSVKEFTGCDVYVSYRIMLRNDRKNPYTSKGACFNNWK
ncbi:MAG TPA: DUF5723 family protein [Bacteroidales bacterium]|nr:hypothetical protein [Bacteroidales bacterium]HNQ82489.1 DUF5723 family protein [Bacteroidales bacterium]HOX79368.1 DUF5723 family protein [Bacteroidales bacterium]